MGSPAICQAMEGGAWDQNVVTAGEESVSQLAELVRAGSKTVQQQDGALGLGSVSQQMSPTSGIDLWAVTRLQLGDALGSFSIVPGRIGRWMGLICHAALNSEVG